MADGRAWPRISIVTPSFNQGRYLEETIRSVLCQGYPNLEYIIIDGGSTDNSVEIIKRYADRIAYWVSEKDDGQVEAICKGAARCTGEIINWLNADDYLLPGSLKAIAEAWQACSRQDVVLCGDGVRVGMNGAFLRCCKVATITEPIIPGPPVGGGIQASWFVGKRGWDRIGGLDRTLDYTMDTDFYQRCYENGFLFKQLDVALAAYREHDSTKTIRGWKRSIAFKKRYYGKHLSALPPRERSLYEPRVRKLIWGLHLRSLTRGDSFFTRAQKVCGAISVWPSSLFEPRRAAGLVWGLLTGTSLERRLLLLARDDPQGNEHSRVA